MCNSQSNRPGRLRAPSTAEARFVAPRTNTPPTRELALPGALMRFLTLVSGSVSCAARPRTASANATTDSSDTSSARIRAVSEGRSSGPKSERGDGALVDPRPSMSASMVATTLASTSPLHSRRGQRPSTSSTKRMQGALLSAWAKVRRRRASLSPRTPDAMSPPPFTTMRGRRRRAAAWRHGHRPQNALRLRHVPLDAAPWANAESGL